MLLSSSFRLDPAPLTEEDDRCWYRVMCRKNGKAFGLRSFSVQPDRRDAYIMLFLESAKTNGCHDALTRMGQIHGFIGSFVRLPGIPARDEDYA